MDGANDRQRNHSAREECALRRGTAAAAVGEGGNGGGRESNEAAVDAAAGVVPPAVDLPGNAPRDEINDGSERASVDDEESEFVDTEDTDRELGLGGVATPYQRQASTSPRSTPQRGTGRSA